MTVLIRLATRPEVSGFGAAALVARLADAAPPAVSTILIREPAGTCAARAAAAAAKLAVGQGAR